MHSATPISAIGAPTIALVGVFERLSSHGLPQRVYRVVGAVLSPTTTKGVKGRRS